MIPLNFLDNREISRPADLEQMLLLGEAPEIEDRPAKKKQLG
ncbi:hypothetical protein [Hyphomicrobium sp. D-2]|nr:hypothetical protein [Hyphomicrobium sp. D-2]MDH4983026.1 hypothetical protein [Hyphomicrobium sp. D-2]